MRKIIECNEGEYETLCEIWERSVRASHGFLTDKAVLEIKSALIPDYFPAVRLYAIEDDGRLTAFIGLAQDRIEMLFVDASMRGMGYGTALIGFARDNGARFVDVNEQNPAALRFYLDAGFHIIGHDETDGAGRPYPILHLSL